MPNIEALEFKLAEMEKARAQEDCGLYKAIPMPEKVSLLQSLLNRRKSLNIVLSDLDAAIRVLEANPSAAEDFETIRKVY